MSNRLFNQLCAATFALAAILFGVPGCETGVDPNPLPDPQDPGPVVGDPDVANPSGFWRRESGRLFSFGHYQLEYLMLGDDGSIRTTVRDQLTNILYCTDGLYAHFEGAIVMDLTGRDVQSISGSDVMLIEMPDADSLQLMDRNEMTTFVREADVPVGYQCKEVVVEAYFEGLDVMPDYYSGLAYDGTLLWFRDRDSDLIYPIDPESGELGMARNLTRAKDVQAFQGDDFWSVCNCSNRVLVERRTKLDVVLDEVSEAELNVEFYANAAAFDNTEKVLWIYGENTTTERNGFLKVNAEPAAPDANELLDQAEFDAYLDAIAADGPYLWALADSDSPHIVKIDTRTYRAVATYTLPHDRVRWYGIAVGGDYLYLIGRNYEQDTGVLMKLAKD